MKKRILSAFLCLCMMLTLAPAAFASDTGETGGGSSTGNNDKDITVEAVDWAASSEATFKASYDTETKKIVVTGDITKTPFSDTVTAVNIKLTFNNAEVFESAQPCEITLTLENGKIVPAVAKDNNLPKDYTFDAENSSFTLPKDPGTGGDAPKMTVTLGADDTTSLTATANADKTTITIAGNVNADIFGTDGSKKPVVTIAFENLTDTYTGTLVLAADGNTANFVATSDPEQKLPAAYENCKITSTITVETTEKPVETDMKADLEKSGDGTLKIEPNPDTAKKELLLSGTMKASAFGTDYKTTPKVTISFVGEEEATYVGTLKYDPDTKKITFTAETGQAMPENYKGYSVVVSDIKVETTEDPASDMKLVSASYGVEGQKDPVALNFAFDKDDAKVINLTGKIDETLLADGKEVEGKLVYTLGSEDEQSYLFLLFFKDGKVDGKDKGEIKLPDGYAINYAGITTTKADEPQVPEGVKPVETPVTDVTNIPKDNQTAATEVATSIKTEKVDDIAKAAAAELDQIVKTENPTAAQEIVVFLAVEAKEYKTNPDGTVESFKLDITPKYEVVNKGSAPTGTNAKPLTSIEKEIVVTVDLPEKFADANDENVYARHTHGTKTYIMHVIVDGSRKGTFTMKGFSDVEFYKDTRTVTVKYNGETEKGEYSYTLASVDTDLKTDSKKDATFKGWALTDNATTAKYSGKITESVLNDLIKDASGKTLNLYPVFETKSGGNTTTSGGGGGSKRPSNNNNNTSTGTNPPSNYGDNPSNPSTPSTPASKTGFSDVVAGGWYEDAVQYMKDNGLMAGTSATTFAPDATTTRGMIVTILYRLEKEPAAAAASSFSDIAAGEWYSNAVAWAAANNIVSGYENGTFGAGDVITREQMAAILFRYASFKGYDVTKTADLSAFADAAQVSAYAADAMKWANAAGLISGTSATTLAPAGSATRAQAASILMRFCENVAK